MLAEISRYLGLVFSFYGFYFCIAWGAAIFLNFDELKISLKFWEPFVIWPLMMTASTLCLIFVLILFFKG